MSDIHLREWLSDCADEMQMEGRKDGARLALRCMERLVDAADAERRAEQAERERDEARREAERYRNLYAGTPPGTELMEHWQLPWEREEAEGE